MSLVSLGAVRAATACDHVRPGLALLPGALIGLEMWAVAAIGGRVGRSDSVGQGRQGDGQMFLLLCDDCCGFDVFDGFDGLGGLVVSVCVFFLC